VWPRFEVVVAHCGFFAGGVELHFVEELAAEGVNVVAVVGQGAAGCPVFAGEEGVGAVAGVVEVAQVVAVAPGDHAASGSVVDVGVPGVGGELVAGVVGHRAQAGGVGEVAGGFRIGEFAQTFSVAVEGLEAVDRAVAGTEAGLGKSGAFPGFFYHTHCRVVIEKELASVLSGFMLNA
jgi:hypothetical protein